MLVDVGTDDGKDEGNLAKKIAQLTKPFINRIVGHGEEAVDQLLANPLNFRLHPDNQQQALAGAIDDIGFIRSVTVNQRTGRVVEISPAYVSVALERWHVMTGKQPELLDILTL